MAKSSPNRESDAMRISRQTLAVANLIGIVSVLGAPTMAAALTCRALEGGVAFTPAEIREVPAAAVEVQGVPKSATSSTTSTANGISLAAAIASTSASGPGATASLSVTAHGRLGLDCQ